jgi:hypothetical protein
MAVRSLKFRGRPHCEKTSTCWAASTADRDDNRSTHPDGGPAPGSATSKCRTFEVAEAAVGKVVPGGCVVELPSSSFALDGREIGQTQSG